MVNVNRVSYQTHVWFSEDCGRRNNCERYITTGMIFTNTKWYFWDINDVIYEYRYMLDQFQLYWIDLFLNIHGLVRERQSISVRAETKEIPSGFVLHAGKTHGYAHQFGKDQIHENIAALFAGWAPVHRDPWWSFLYCSMKPISIVVK